jgi:hypothetical protein
MYRFNGSQKSKSFTIVALFTRVSNNPFLHFGHNFFVIYFSSWGRGQTAYGQLTYRYFRIS